MFNPKQIHCPEVPFWETDYFRLALVLNRTRVLAEQ